METHAVLDMDKQRDAVVTAVGALAVVIHVQDRTLAAATVATRVGLVATVHIT